MNSFSRTMALVCFAALSGGVLRAATDGNPDEIEFRKVTDDPEVVKNKIFPKKSRIELNGPNFGGILNQSYVNTFLLNVGVNYFWSEVWGLGLDFSYAMNQDKEERKCLETFYNDNPDQPNAIPEQCRGSKGTDQSSVMNATTGPNYGPAYVPIREIKYMIMGNAIWNPVYGKQIMLRSATAYFDLFVTMGGGMAFSTYYPKATVLKNGRKARGNFSDTGGESIGAMPEETNSYGTAGRPQPIEQSTPVLNFGIGQKYHFAKRFSVKLELRNDTLLGTESGFDNFFTLWGGFGLRL